MIARHHTPLYLEHIYPFLRGAHGINPLTRFTRRMTEPGGPERLAWVLDELGDSAHQRVLDVGCGTGTFTVELAARGHDVTALDIARPMLAATSRAAAAAQVSDRVHLIRADVRQWEPRHRFDTVLCIGVLGYYPEATAEHVIRTLYSATDRLLLTIDCAGPGFWTRVRKTWLSLNGVRAQFYDRDRFERMLGRSLDADLRIREMRWTHCVAASRRAASPASSLDRAQDNGITRPPAPLSSART